MDSEQHWNWHAGLLRRTALGLVVYTISVVLFCALSASTLGERGRLEELGRLAQLHRTMNHAYASLDAMARQLSNSPSLGMARSAIEPMALGLERVDITAPGAATISRLDCLTPWVDALRALQFAPYSAESACDVRGAGSWRCREGQDLLPLQSLATFERGLLAVVELQTYLTDEADCKTIRNAQGDLVVTPVHHARVCLLYHSIGETSWRQLHDFAARHNPPRPDAIRGRQYGRADKCFPGRSPLQDHVAFAARAGGSGGALSVRDFSRLGQKLSEEERAIAGRQQGVTAGPEGLVSMVLSRTTSLFLLAIAGFLALAYARYNAGKLCALNETLSLDRREEYRMFTRLSQMFTLPVFRERLGTSLVERVLTLLGWAPWFALVCGFGALAILCTSPNLFGGATLAGLVVVMLMQLLMLGGFEHTRRRLVAGYQSTEPATAGTQETKGKSP